MDNYRVGIVEIVVVLLLLSLNSSATSYVYGPNGLLARVNESGNITYFHLDNIGSTGAITNEAGEVVEEQVNLPFGELIQSGERFGFTGKEFDSDPGLNYFGARYYDPTTGKFRTADPVRDGMDWYSYANNNPLRYIDPRGEKASSVKDRLSSFVEEIYDRYKPEMFDQIHREEIERIRTDLRDEAETKKSKNKAVRVGDSIMDFLGRIAYSVLPMRNPPRPTTPKKIKRAMKLAEYVKDFQPEEGANPQRDLAFELGKVLKRDYGIRFNVLEIHFHDDEHAKEDPPKYYILELNVKVKIDGKNRRMPYLLIPSEQQIAIIPGIKKEYNIGVDGWFSDRRVYQPSDWYIDDYFW